MLRLIELAGVLVADGTLCAVGHRDLSEADVRAAAEMLIVGTTLNLVAVREYEGRPVGTGRPGPVYQRLGRMLDDDIRSNAALRVELV